MARNIKPENRGAGGGDDHSTQNEEEYTWLLTYSDMITLLLAFFAMWIGISNVDLNLFEQFKEGLRSEVTATEETVTPLTEIKRDLDSLLVKERKQGRVSIELGREGIVMQFRSRYFYNQGEAQMLDQGKDIIDKVLNVLTTQRMQRYKHFNIDVEGHTDDVSIQTQRFPSNWELSAARATNVVRYFIENGISADRLKASGFADTEPLVPIKNEFSEKVIKANRDKNRRITLRIYYPRDMASGNEEEPDR